MSNHLTSENSPYLLQHAENPVDWYPWGKEALEKAKSENKPIFLSIGYAACHWCHVMSHESFEDPGTATLMNEHFVNIKVDREERPDLDNIYMSATQAMTGSGGWPMSVFLTPDLQPFYAGTYFPPVRRYNMPSFREVLLSVARAWQNERSELIHSSQDLLQHIRQETMLNDSRESLNRGALDRAAMTLAQHYDWTYGGWGKAPRFPQPMVVEFLLRRAAQGDKMALDMAVHALRAMAKGGMYDVVGGGFSRYSTDDLWLVPHFEKMLYDNAQLALVYLHGYLITGEASFRRICEETLNFVLREMTHPLGGFYSSLDADSEGEEGKFYIWTPAEIRAALAPAEQELFFAVYHITEQGNFEGSNVLQRSQDEAELAEQLSISPDELVSRLQSIHSRLLETRSKRVRPGTDEKILTAWNALMLAAFAEAGRYLHSETFTRVGMRNADFLLSQLDQEDRLLRSWRDGTAQHAAYLEDYASLILALLSIYQSDPQVRWFTSATRLAEEMLAHFTDPQGGFFDTRDDHEVLLYRPKDVQDNAVPSGNALAALALLQLSAYTGRGDLRDTAETALKSIQSTAARYPTAFAQWLTAQDFALNPAHEIAILGNFDSPDTQALLDVVWQQYRPHSVVAISPVSAPPGSPPLLDDRGLLKDRPTAFVCQGFVCQQPVNSPNELESQLGDLVAKTTL
jgi:uncharacterized protein YyaL (SSP411 family)